MSGAGLGRRVVSNTGFGLLDLAVTKLGTTAVFVLLVRLLPSSDIAAIGIAAGYLVFVSYLDLSPVRALLRDFPRFARDRDARDRLFTGLAGFWLTQAVAMVGVSAVLIGTALGNLRFEGLGFLFLGLTLDLVAQTFQDWIKVVHYADFRQRFATGLSLAVNLGRLAVYALLLIDPSLELYAWLLIATSAVTCLVWGTAFQLHYRFRPRFVRSSLEELLHSLRTYGLWDHLNRSATDTLFLVDTVVLSAFALFARLDSYTIALKFTSMLFLVSFQLEKGLQLALAYYSDDERRRKAIHSFLKLNGLTSLGQLAVVLLLGRWLLGLLFGEAADASTWTFTWIITLGVTVHNLSRPLVAVINNLCSLREAFLRVFLPASAAGVGVYVAFAALWGSVGVAWGNVVVYSSLAVGLAAFVGRRYPFPLPRRLATREEKELVLSVLRAARPRR